MREGGIEGGREGGGEAGRASEDRGGTHLAPTAPTAVSPLTWPLRFPRRRSPCVGSASPVAASDSY